MASSDNQSRVGPKRRTFLKATGASGLAAVTGLAGCTGGDGDGDGGTATGTPMAEEPTKIGYLIPQSGPLSVTAEFFEKGRDSALDHINEDLGGINGETVLSATADTQTDPAAGREAARKLVESDGADVLMGALSGAVNLAIADYAYDAGVPYWGCGGAESHTGADCTPTAFLYQYSARMDARAGLDYCLSNFGPNVWIHYADYSFGQSLSETWQAQLEKTDMESNLIDVTKTPLGTSDYSSYISQIQASDADWVFSAVTGSDAINFMKQAGEFGLKDEMDIMNPVTYQQPLRKGAGEAVIGTHTLIRYYHGYDTPENKEYVDLFTSKYGEPPTDFSSILWSSGRLYTKAANNVGTTALEEIVPELEGMESNEPMGPTKVRKCDHQCIRDYPIGEIVEPGEYGWPDMDVREVKPGEEVIEPCSESNCDMPSL